MYKICLINIEHFTTDISLAMNVLQLCTNFLKSITMKVLLHKKNLILSLSFCRIVSSQIQMDIKPNAFEFCSTFVISAI